MTGRASPGKCATRTGPCFRSNRDFDTYTTFDILPPSRFFQPIPKWERRYSIDFACLKKCLDKVAVVVVTSLMLARRLDHSPRRKSFPCILLEPLCALFPHSSLYFQSLAASFPKTPGVGVSRPFRAELRFRRHIRHVAPLCSVASVDCADFPSPRGCTHSLKHPPYSAPALFVRPSFRKVPFSNSVKAWRSCSWVFMTMGPYQATGSSSGLPETNRKRMPFSPAIHPNSHHSSEKDNTRIPSPDDLRGPRPPHKYTP